jgi:hypothetical protein
MKGSTDPSDRISKEDMDRLLKYRPPELPSGPSSSRLPRERLGLAGLRLDIEELLRSSCGPEIEAKILAMGERAGPVLVKIANAKSCCECCGGVRSGAIALLSQTAHPDAVPTLLGILGDESEEASVRCQAMLSLGRTGSKSGIGRLLEILRTAADPLLRQAAARSLGESCLLEALPGLELAARTDRDSKVRWRAYAAVRGLEKFHGTQLARLKAPPFPKGGRPTKVHVSARRQPTSKK